MSCWVLQSLKWAASLAVSMSPREALSSLTISRSMSFLYLCHLLSKYFGSRFRGMPRLLFRHQLIP